jgi:hypothetical protein
MQNDLSGKILSTLMYYDKLDYPLTPFEIWKYLSRNTNHESDITDRRNSLAEIISGLKSEELKNKIEEYQGFYFFTGKKDLVEKRLERNKISQLKIKKIKKVVWWLRMMPFVRMVAVTGTVAMKNSDGKSDLDLFIVLKHGHIFTGRTLVTLVVHLLGKRRHGNKITDRICLNFFVTDESLNTDFRNIFKTKEELEIEPANHFCASEHFFLSSIFDTGIFAKFKKENRWISSYFENYYLASGENAKKMKDIFASRNIRKIGEVIFSLGILETGLKSWQTKRIDRNPKTHQSGSLVLASDEYLIFLPAPQRAK